MFTIKKIFIDGIALFKYETIEFDDKLNIIVGNNGCCKTILMEIIYLILSNKIHELHKYINDDYCKSNIEITLRFENNNEINILNKIYILHLLYIHQNNINNNDLHYIKNCNFFEDDIIINLKFDNQTKNIIENKISNKNYESLYDSLNKYEKNDKLNNINEVINDKLKEYNNNIIFKRIFKKYFDSSLRNMDEHNYKLKLYIKEKIFYTNVNEKENEIEKMFNIKNSNIDTFIRIRDIFEKITNKKFDLIQNSMYSEKSDSFKIELNYYIIENEKKYVCSHGEKELLNFLGTLYYVETSILLFDEPCNHLSSENKIKIKNILNDYLKNKNTQIILITHDIDMTDIQSQNIIHFSRTDKININYTNKFSDNHKHKLNDNKTILFSKKCLLVEGYDDYRFIKALLEIKKKYCYNIIIMNGCTNADEYANLMKTLNIDYKFILDADVIINHCINNKYKIIENVIGNTEYEIKNVNKIILNIENIMDDTYIDIKIISENLNKIRKYDFLVLIEILNKNFLNNDYENFKPNYETFNNSKVSGKEINELNNYIQNQNNNNNNKMKFSEFKKQFEEIFKEIKEKHKISKTGKPETFTNKLHKNDNNNNDDNEINDFTNKYKYDIAKNNTELRKMYDEIIKFIKNNSNIYIWEIELFDIEGVMKHIKNYDNFTKDKWKTISFYEIKNIIENKINSYEDNKINELINFIIK